MDKKVFIGTYRGRPVYKVEAVDYVKSASCDYDLLVEDKLIQNGEIIASVDKNLNVTPCPAVKYKPVEVVKEKPIRGDVFVEDILKSAMDPLELDNNDFKIEDLMYKEL